MSKKDTDTPAGTPNEEFDESSYVDLGDLGTVNHATLAAADPFSNEFLKTAEENQEVLPKLIEECRQKLDTLTNRELIFRDKKKTITDAWLEEMAGWAKGKHLTAGETHDLIRQLTFRLHPATLEFEEVSEIDSVQKKIIEGKNKLSPKTLQTNITQILTTSKDRLKAGSFKITDEMTLGQALEILLSEPSQEKLEFTSMLLHHVESRTDIENTPGLSSEVINLLERKNRKEIRRSSTEPLSGPAGRVQ